jgi:hypothetical protein
VLSRLSMPFLAGLIVLQLFNIPINASLANWMTRSFDLKPVPSELGIHFAATATLSAIILSYVFFVVYIRREGRESFRMRNELELAHGIQKTLVPPVGLRTSRFEIYGISHPSEKVGGDLVDAIYLPSGDAIAYVADIAGHGLPAGILMGMLKTATRTVLLDAEGREPHRTLPVLLACVVCEVANRYLEALEAIANPQASVENTVARITLEGVYLDSIPPGKTRSSIPFL